MGSLLCEQNFRDVWIRNKSVQAEIGQILHTHTHTTAAKFVVRIPVAPVAMIGVTVCHCLSHRFHPFHHLCPDSERDRNCLSVAS